MSAHCYHPWKLGQPVDEKLLHVLVETVVANKRVRDGLNLYRPEAFVVNNHADGLVLVIAQLIDGWRAHNHPIEWFDSDDGDDDNGLPREVIEAVRTCAKRVVQAEVTA